MVLQRHGKVVDVDPQRHGKIKRGDRSAGIPMCQIQPDPATGELYAAIQEIRAQVSGQLGPIALEQIANHDRNELAGHAGLFIDDVVDQ